MKLLRTPGPPDYQPPHDEIAGSLTGPPYVAHGIRTAVIVPSIQVYSTGLLVPLDVRLQENATPGSCRTELLRLMHNDREPVFGRLHLALTYPDGTITQNLDKPEPPHPGSPYRAPLLQAAGQSGPRWQLAYWVRDLPTPGPTTLTLEWLNRDLNLTRFEIPSDAIAAAYDRIEYLWA
jgi:hypothetical protein